MEIASRLRPQEGLRVFVTAGASGIGRRIVEGYRECGARVAVCDVSEEALSAFRKDAPEAVALACDVGDRKALADTVAEAGDKLGGFDVVINNAGIAGPTGKVEEISAEDWEATLRIDLDSQFHVAHATAAALKESQGWMLNIASVAGRLGYAYRTPYAAAKWGVVGFTKSLAAEMGPDGVRVNAILPGIVEGARIRGVIGARAKAVGVSYEEMESRYLANVSLRRMVSPDDVAATCLFLTSPAGGNISGQAISVCGNVEVLT